MKRQILAFLLGLGSLAYAQPPIYIPPGQPNMAQTVNTNFTNSYRQKIGRWHGTGAPGSFPYSVKYDLYFNDSSPGSVYVCFKLIACTTVAANNWVLISGGGGGGTPGGSNNDVQVNSSGTFGGARCTMDSSSNFLCTGTITAPSFIGSNAAASGQTYLQGLTSGGVAWGVADVAGTAIVYVLPTTNGTAGQVLQDSGLVTCPTYAAGGPSTCHQLIWASAAGAGVTSFTGDGVVYTNVASFGAVTGALGTAAAHKYLGNPTGSPATWAASSIVAADLPTTTVNAVSNDTNVTGSISGQTLTLGWQNLLAAARMVNSGVHTGDAAGTFPAVTLATVNSNVGTFGSSTQVPQFVVNAKGLITAVSNVAITAGTGNAAARVTTTFSATPTFTCPSSTAGTIVDFTLSTVLSANITSSTLSTCTSGSILNFSFVQAAASAFTVAMPTGFSQACQVSGIFNAITNMSFNWDGTNAQLISCTVDRGPSTGAEQAAPSGSPASGVEWTWLDSTGLFLRLKNSAGTIFQMAKELTSGNVRCAGGANTVDAACSSGQILTALGSSIALAGSPTTTTQAAQDNSTKIATTAYVDRMKARALAFSIGDPTNSSALTTSSVSGTLTVPYACTISAYALAFGPGDTGTITVKFWKVATGTAIPTISNVINTSGVSIASGTAIRSATVSDFTTTAVAANDMIAMVVTAVATTKSITGVLQCDQ